MQARAAAGLITAVVAGPVAAVFGGSNVQVSGPTGAMAMVLAPVVSEHGAGSIALVTVLAGVLVVAAGITGLGRAATFIPWPVIEGFTLGIAAIIFLQQAPAAFGAHTLAEIAEDLESRGITVIIKGVQTEHMALLANLGIVDALRHENHLIDSLDEAVAHARRHAAANLDSPAGAL